MTNKIQISGKIGDIILVIGADTPEEFLSSCNVMLGNAASEAVQGAFSVCFDKNFLDEAEKVVNVTFTSAPAAATSNAPANTGATDSPAASPDGPKTETDKWGGEWTYGIPTAPSCPHGQRVMKKAISQAGKPYKAWCCVTHSPMAYRQKVNKDTNCQMEFMR